MGQSLDGETEARGPPCERQLTPLPGHRRCPGPCVEQAWPPAPTCPATPAESWKGFSVVSLLAGQGTVLAAGRHRPAFAPCLKRPHFPLCPQPQAEPHTPSSPPLPVAHSGLMSPLPASQRPPVLPRPSGTRPGRALTALGDSGVAVALEALPRRGAAHSSGSASPGFKS